METSECQIVHILPTLNLITQISGCIINDNLETNGAEFCALRKSSAKNFVLWDCLIVTNTLGTIADKVTQLRDDRSANSQADKFLNNDVTVNHIKRFGEIRQNHRPNVIDLDSTLMECMKKTN